jgi:hypothetical protein
MQPLVETAVDVLPLGIPFDSANRQEYTGRLLTPRHSMEYSNASEDISYIRFII